MLFHASEGPKVTLVTLKGRKGASMDACTNMAISTLPLVLLKTHVMTMALAMANRPNLTIARMHAARSRAEQRSGARAGKTLACHRRPEQRRTRQRAVVKGNRGYKTPRGG